MRKSLFAIAPAALLLMSVAGTSQAADNAVITVQGNIQAATCDVTSSTSLLDLGTHKPAAFTAVKTPVAASTKGFTLTLSNCDVTNDAVEHTASLAIDGNTLAGESNIFSDNSLGHYGVMFNKTGETTYFNAGDEIEVAKTSSAPVAGDLNGKVLNMEASLASLATSPGTGRMKAPVSFQFVYN
jgi:major type 1 subunit fimbrin (pilin)